ncbi:MAG TPA: adenosylcobinamide-GDP ribazoletransferase [Mycobacteriales bacterium]|nr:adenosylcobinamide-GDP ribazoletransferase [Mycobacteriales bacterium]
MTRGLRLALSLLTILRVRAADPTRDDARWAMTLAPLVGLALGIVAAAAVFATRLLAPSDATPVLAGTVGVATLAALTRGLHLDGLADTADGLGSLRRPADAAAVMRRGDVGPFGVVTLVLVLLLQATSLAACVTVGRATVAVVTATVAGRVAATLSCTPRTPPMSATGLGALVAGTVPRAVALGWAAAATAAAFAAGWYDDARRWHGGTHLALAVVLALAAAHALRWRAVRRLGGVNGDVLGAQVEVAATVVLLVTAL